MRFRVKTWRPGVGVDSMLIDAASAAEAARRAGEDGVAVLAVRTAIGWGPASHGGFTLLLFCRELLSLLESGISVVEAIETLGVNERRTGSRAVLLEVLGGLREGRTLSSACEAVPSVFPPLFIATIRASEQTGNLGEALTRYVAHQTQLEALRARLVAAAVYPALLAIVGMLVVIFLMGFVVPRFSHIYADLQGELPLLSRWLLQWGGLVERRAVELLLAGILFVAGLVWAARNARIRSFLVERSWELPGIGERLRLIQLARCYRSLGMLLRGGIPIARALELIPGLLAPPLREALAATAQRIREGAAASTAFETNGLATPVALRLLRVGERGGNLGEMFERSGQFHDEETGRWLEMVSRLAGPLLMLVMGLCIGVIVVLMYLPVFQLAESIR